jgi:hypothetical protein
MQEYQEGLEPPAKKTALDVAWEDLLIRQGNAFLDYMMQADEEQKHFAKCAFRMGDRPSCVWVLKEESIQLVNGLGSVMLQVKRNQPPGPRSPVDPWPLLRFPWSHDDSIKLLPREILCMIYALLKDPADMWSFMQVNKTFYKAGELYPNYQPHIQKLLPAFVYPFWDTSFKPRQFFFAMCFVSCKTDKQLAAKWMKHIRTDGSGDKKQIEMGNEALLYVLYHLGDNTNVGFARDAEDWTVVYRNENTQYGAYFMHRIVDDLGLHTSRGSFKEIPLGRIRKEIIKRLFS